MTQNNGVNVGLERLGFPVHVGEVEFFFGTSAEELKRFFSVQEEIEEKLKLIGEPAKDASADEIIRLLNEQCAVHYDALLGEGAYKRIYDKFPYADVLFDNLELVSMGIANRIEKESEIRADSFNKKKAEFMKKKLAKKKKKK